MTTGRHHVAISVNNLKQPAIKARTSHISRKIFLIKRIFSGLKTSSLKTVNQSPSLVTAFRLTDPCRGSMCSNDVVANKTQSARTLLFFALFFRIQYKDIFLR